MAFLHPHLAQPKGGFFFTSDAVDDAEFFGDERETKRRRIEDLSQRYLKGGTLVIQSAKLRGPFTTTRRRVQEQPRKRCGVQQRVDGILRREREVRPAEPSSPVPEKTPPVVKEATREWLRRLEPPTPSPEVEGDISRLEDRLDRLQHRTPSKPSYPPPIGKNPTVNHVLRKNNLKSCFKEKKKASKANKTLASDSLLDLYDLDLSGKPAVRSNSQPTLVGIPPSLQVNVDEDSIRREPTLVEDDEEIRDESRRVDRKQDGPSEPTPNPDIAREQPALTYIPLSLQANVDEDSVRRDPEAGNEDGKMDLDQEDKPPGPPTPDVGQETHARAPLTCRTTSIVSSPVRKTVRIADGQENVPSDVKTIKEPPMARPQHSRMLSDPTRQKEKPKKVHTLHASPTVTHSPFVYRKVSEEEKPKATMNKGPRRWAATARFVEFVSSPKPRLVVDEHGNARTETTRGEDSPRRSVDHRTRYSGLWEDGRDSNQGNNPPNPGQCSIHVDQAKPVEVVDEPKRPDSGVDGNVPTEKVLTEDVFNEEVSYEEIPEDKAPKHEAPQDDDLKAEALENHGPKEEDPIDAPIDAPIEAPKEEDEDTPESLLLNFSTQAALITAQQAFQQQLVSPAKKSNIYNILDPDPIFASQNTTPPPPGSPPTFSPITPFRFVNQEDCKPSEKSEAPPVSTQELFNAATPFAFSTVKKQKPRKSVTIGIPSLLNPNTKSAGIASLLNPTDISPTFTPVHGKLQNQIKSTGPTFSSVNGKPQRNSKSISPNFTPISGEPQKVPQSISPRWTPINSQSASPRWTPINSKREGDGDTTIADPTGTFNASEVVTGTPAASPSKRRKPRARKRSLPEAIRPVPVAPKPAPTALTSALASSQPPPSTAPPTVSQPSQSQPQTRHTTTPSPLLQRRRCSVGPSATMSSLLSTWGTRPGHSTMQPAQLPDAQPRSCALLGDDEDVDVDAVVEDADTFLSTWDWRKELGSVGS
ncbi:hypothetical protein IWZ01DRAFT_208738 [Phyllosticta capitalensis]